MYCTKCGKQITEDSNCCTFCGEKVSRETSNLIKKKKPVYKKVWFWILIVFLLIAGIGMSGGENTNDDLSNSTLTSGNIVENNNENKETEKTITTVGQTLTTKYFKVTVKSLKKLEGDSFNKPSSGNEFVQVQLEIENISDDDFTISSILMFNAYYDGYSVNESLSAQIADNSISTMDGALAKGKKIKGQLAYELPKDWKELEIDVDLTTMKWSNDGKIKIKLQNQ